MMRSPGLAVRPLTRSALERNIKALLPMAHLVKRNHRWALVRRGGGVLVEADSLLEMGEAVYAALKGVTETQVPENR